MYRKLKSPRTQNLSAFHICLRMMLYKLWLLFLLKDWGRYTTPNWKVRPEIFKLIKQTSKWIIIFWWFKYIKNKVKTNFTFPGLVKIYCCRGSRLCQTCNTGSTGVSKRVKHSCLRFNCANNGLKEVPLQCAVAPHVLRWTVHGTLTVQRRCCSICHWRSVLSYLFELKNWLVLRMRPPLRSAPGGS